MNVPPRVEAAYVALVATVRRSRLVLEYLLAGGAQGKVKASGTGPVLI